jgi:hypothetical protein
MAEGRTTAMGLVALGRIGWPAKSRVACAFSVWVDQITVVVSKLLAKRVQAS